MQKNVKSVFDIGCDEGYLLYKFDKNIKRDGIDPRLNKTIREDGLFLKKGFFPKNITDSQMKNSYDVVFALAVFEHFSQNDLKQSASVISKMLTKNGRLIITVPESKVDDILFFLKSFKLIDGQALEEHHHFNSNNIFKYFSKNLNLIKHKKFQFGLNNLYVFEKRS